MSGTGVGWTPTHGHCSPHSSVSMWCGGGGDGAPDETASWTLRRGASYVIQGLGKRSEPAWHILFPFQSQTVHRKHMFCPPGIPNPSSLQAPGGEWEPGRGLQRPSPATWDVMGKVMLRWGPSPVAHGPQPLTSSVDLVETSCSLLPICNSYMLWGREREGCHWLLYVSHLLLRLAGPNMCFLGC